MNYPPDRTMQSLQTLVIGKKFVILDTDQMTVQLELPGREPILWEITGEELDTLLALGWVMAKDDWIEATERGRYWLKRYLTQTRQQVRREAKTQQAGAR